MPEPIAPLDAYATAKPDEPTFTLQAGDPLAAPLVRLWAACARGMTGLRINVHELAKAVIDNTTAEPRDVDSLRLRATAAEEVSWNMDAYRAGRTNAKEPKTAPENFLDEKARLDLHDLRVRYAQKMSGFAAELKEMQDELQRRGWLIDQDELDNIVTGLILQLRCFVETLEPRRLFRK